MTNQPTLIQTARLQLHRANKQAHDASMIYFRTKRISDKARWRIAEMRQSKAQRLLQRVNEFVSGSSFLLQRQGDI